MKKASFRLISIFLALLFLAQTLPLAVFAVELRKEAATAVTEIEPIPETRVEKNESESSETVPEPTVLNEVEDRREPNKKTFRMSDGTFREAVYPYDVHYEENGKLLDINNTLVKDSDAGEAVLVNEANASAVRFFKKSSSGKFYSLENEKTKVIVSIEGAEKTDAVYENTPKTSGNRMALTNLTGRVRYEEIFPNVDLEFTLVSKQIKENIIIKEKSKLSSLTYTYSFNGGMTAVQENNRTINIYEKNTENELFTITAPALWDSVGNYSEDLTLTIVEIKNSKLTVRLDFTIDEEMVYPVTVDPILRFQSQRNEIQDTHIISAYPTTNYNTNNHIRIRNNGYTLLKFPIPTLRPGDKIINAQFALFPYGYFDKSHPVYSNVNSFYPTLKLTAHKINRGWEETSVTYSNADPDNGFYDPIVESYHVVGSDTEFYSWDITRLAMKWTEGSVANHGILLKYAAPPSDGSMFDTFFCSTNGAYLQEEVWPQIVYSYVNTIGIEEYFSYHTQSLGFAGEGYVNDMTGNLTVTRELLTTGGNVAPISLSLFYNASTYNSSAAATPYGNGWKLNLAQKCVKLTPAGSSEPYIQYTDADGTQHYFKKDSNGVWVDEIDPDRKIYEVASNSNLEMKDSSGTTLHFLKRAGLDEWYLNQIVDLYGNNVQVHTDANDPNRINQVVSSNGTTVWLDYNTAGFLSAVRYMDEGTQKSISILYSNNSVSSITFPDGSAAQYSYGYWGDGMRLSSAQSLDGTRIEYDYSNKTGRVISIRELSSAGTEGNRFTFAYEPTSTTVTDTRLGRTYLYTFSANGTLKSVIDTTANDGNGYGQYYEYNGGNTSLTGMGNLTFASKTQKSTVNLLPNHNFENGSEPVPTGSGSSSGAVTSDKSRIGWRSYRVSTTDTGSTSYSVAQYAVSLIGGTRYTFSAYVNTSQMTSPADSGGAYLYVQNSSSHWESEFVRGVSDSWQRISLSFTPSVSDSYLVVFGMKGATGSAYFDNVQLEVGDLSEYNLLENAGFETNLGWGYHALVTLSSEEKLSGVRAGKIIGNPDTGQHFAQTITVANGRAGDTYVASAFAKTTAAAAGEWYFTLLVRFLKNGSTVSEQSIPFNGYTTEWQKISGVAKAQGEYDSIDFFLLYYDNCNTVYFDNAQLIQDIFGNTYTYDTKGNLISTVDLQGKEENSFAYDGNNQLVRQSDISGGEILYSYDRSKTTQLEQVTAGGNTTAFTYDVFGNATSSVTTGSELIPGEYYYLQNLHTSEYLDATTAANTAGGRIDIEPFAKNSAQKWKLIANSDGTYSFEPECATGKYLTGIGFWDYGAIELRAAGSSNDQKIRVEKIHSNLYFLIFASNPSFSVDGNGSNCYVYSTNATRCQKFAFIPVNTQSETFPSISSSATYTEQTGKYMTSLTDSRGNTVNYAYNEDRGYVKSETDPKGTVTGYTYNAGEQLSSVSVDGSTVTYGYNSAKQLITITTPGANGGSVYGITYDAFGRKSDVTVGGNSLATYAYNAIGQTETVTYGNGAVTRYLYDELGRLTETVINDIPQSRIVYDGSSRVHEQYDLIGNRKVKFEYDILDREVKRSLYDTANNTLLSEIRTRYDDTKNRIAGYEVLTGDKSTSYTYGYGENKAAPDAVTSVKVRNSNLIENEYDSLNRLSTRTLKTTTPVETTYTYKSSNDLNHFRDLNHYDVIPEGASYTPAEGAQLIAGQAFPSTVAEDDVYAYGDYLYTFETGMGGWSVTLNSSVTDQAQTSYGTILESINFRSVLSMNYTFYECENLTTAPQIPESVIYLDYAFGNCTSLTAAPTIPSKVVSMVATFSNCTSLVSPPNMENAVSVTDLSSTFYGCTALETAPIIPESVTNMYATFLSCSSLEVAPVIPESVTDMYGTFYGCSSLTTAPAIPKNVTTMYSAFLGCSSLVTPPDLSQATSVTDFSYAFFQCTSLASAPVIPSSVTNMYASFYTCTSLITPPTIPASVTNMGGTFSRCSALTTAPTIPSGVTNMYITFSYCTELTGNIVINANPTNYTNCFDNTEKPIHIVGSCSDSTKIALAETSALGNVSYTLSNTANAQAIIESNAFPNSLVQTEQSESIILPQSILLSSSAFSQVSRSTATKNYMSSRQTRSSNGSENEAGTNASATTGTLVGKISEEGFTSYYTYDVNGNITSYTRTNDATGEKVETWIYEYDAKNQLIFAGSDGAHGTRYTYDANGNILTKTDVATGNVTHYTYSDSNWKDLLTAYKGDLITYDDIGNPLQYRDGMNFTWVNGRKLGSVTQNGTTTTFTYDGDGNRIRKVRGNTTVEYIVIGGTIYGEIRTTNGTTISLHYLFDENGNRIGFVVNGNDTYYYRFNLQGDVTGIYDAAGNLVAEYAYDAWGKLIDSDNTEIGNLNPIRYRGYYYDDETGFYYLQTRYYDPETGRFISPDAYLSTGQGVLGYNMYAYCLNNPVNYYDPTGCACICLTQRVHPRHRCDSIGSFSTSNSKSNLSEPLRPSISSEPSMPIKLNPTTTILAQTIYGESGGRYQYPNDWKEGMQAVATVIVNRFESPKYPNDYVAICTSPSQFTGYARGKKLYNKGELDSIMWDEAMRLAINIVSNTFTPYPQMNSQYIYFHSSSYGNTDTINRVKQKPEVIIKGGNMFYCTYP